MRLTTTCVGLSSYGCSTCHMLFPSRLVVQCLLELNESDSGGMRVAEF